MALSSYTPKPQTGRMGGIINDLDETDRATLLDWLRQDSDVVTNPFIADALTSEGHEVSAETVRKYRNRMKGGRA